MPSSAKKKATRTSGASKRPASTKTSTAKRGASTKSDTKSASRKADGGSKTAAKKTEAASKARKPDGGKTAKKTDSAARTPKSAPKSPKAKTKVAPSELAQQGEAEQLSRRGRLPTGSLHAQARSPEGADELKAKLTTLMNTLNELKKLGKAFDDQYWRIGEILLQVREQALYEVRGYSSMEMFLERETKLSPAACMTAVRIFETFRPEVATPGAYGRLAAGIDAMDSIDAGDDDIGLGAVRSPIPPHKL